MIDQDSPAFVERRLNGKKKKNSRSKNRITKKKKKQKEICTDLTC